jgi:hypothetical protein
MVQLNVWRAIKNPVLDVSSSIRYMTAEFFEGFFEECDVPIIVGQSDMFELVVYCFSEDVLELGRALNRIKPAGISIAFKPLGGCGGSYTLLEREMYRRGVL